MADQSASPSVMTTSVDLDKPKDKSVFYINPRAGLGGMSSPDGYDMNPRFAGGLAVGVATSEYLSFELGYTYAEYGVGIASGNPFVQQYLNYQAQYGQSTNTLALKQNVIDAGVKLHLLDSASRVRPFLGGGAGWSKSFINYDQKILANLKANPYFANSPAISDYELTSYLGYISTGLDVKMNQNISLDIMARYYAVLSSNESSNLNNYAFANPGYATQAPEKQYVGGSMSSKSFFTILGGVSFAF
jgi:outer membrane protein W